MLTLNIWSNGATTQDLTNVAAGTYTVTVSFGTTCTGTSSFTIAQQPNTPTVTSTTTPSICELANGSVNVSVSGGVPPYTFAWSNGATTEDLNNVLAGTYTVTVTGANGCTSTSSISLTNNNPPITITSVITPNTTCNGGNGGINISVSPSVPPGGGTYTFNWSNGATTEDLTNVAPGNYSVTVDGGGACTATANLTIPDQPNTPNISVNTTPSICELANGDINVSVSGGVTPYTFAWSNGATTEDLDDVLAGSYTVTVTGANGCTSSSTVGLANNNPPITINSTISPNTSCNGGNGSLVITISPAIPSGGGNYVITWSNGASGTNLVGLDPGTYSVTVNGGGACTQTATFTIPDQPNNPTLNPTITPTFCNQSNGGANVSVSGGVGPFTYLWSDGSTGTGINGVPSGSYSVTVTGANGCTATTPINIPNNNVAITISSNVTPNTVCVGPGDGSISITTQPPGLNVIWSNGATGNIISPLDPGSYTVTVSAGGSCTQEASFTVPTQPNEPNLATLMTPAQCGLPTGEAEVQASGGMPGYTYMWSNGGTSPMISPIPAGSYTVTVTGANGCTATASVNIPDEQVPISVFADVTDNTSCLMPNGSISLTVSPPTAGVQWSNGATSTTISTLVPGTYAVTITAGGTCSTATFYTVADMTDIPFLTYDVTNATCGQPNGYIDLNIFNGQAPFFINWSNGSPLEDLYDVLPGLYNVTVTSFAGCSATTTINVPNINSTFSLSGAPSANTSCNSPNGGINLTVTPAGTYTYIWSNGTTTEDLSNIAAGTYTVTVSAGGSCTTVGTYQVTTNASPPVLSTTPTAATCGLSNGGVNLTITGGTTPYTIAWSNMATTEDLANILGGTYAVTVTGANGCSATASANVGNTVTSPNIAGTPAANTSCSTNNGGINITVTPSGTYTYAWSNTATTEDLTNIAAGTYTVTVSAGGSCTSTASFTVANNVSNPNIVESITAAICSQANGGIDLTVTGAIPPYTYAWSNMATTEDIANVLPGTYTVTVTGVNGCSSTASFNVPNNSSNFSLSGVAQPLSSCATVNGSVNLTITPAGSYTINWSNMATTEDISNLTPGTYTVTVSEAGTCSATASYVVGDVTEDPTLSQATTPEVCNLLDGAVNLTVSGSTTPYIFAWSNAATTEDLSNIAGGTYIVTVTGANGCSATTSANVPSNTIAFSINGVTAPNTSCATVTGSVDLTVSPAGSYNYTWSNAATTEDLTGLSGGSYTVTVSAGGSCTSTASYTVASTTLDPVISSNLTPSICGVSNGGIDLTISGGVSPFTFVWASGPTTEDLTNVPPGAYSVQVQGANGCVSTANFTVQDNPIAINVTGTPAANSNCVTPNGLVNINVTPAGTYNFIWSNMETSEDIAGLSPGTYSVTVSQGLTCSSEGNFTVNDNTVDPVLSQVVSPDICAGSVGGINLTMTGNATPYSFAWSNMATTEDLANIVQGAYSVTVTGSDGCTATASYNVPNTSNTFSFTGTTSPNTLCGGGDGSVNITVTPPGTYNFIWSNTATTEDISGLTPGTYEVTISDNGTCTASEVFTVGNNSPAPTVTGTPTNVLCFGGSTGAINLTVTGGVGPYTFDWLPNIPGSPEDPTGLAADTYDVTVTAASGCSSTAGFTINQPVSATQLICNQSGNVSLPGMMDGEAIVTISGGVAPYTVDWNPGGQQNSVAVGAFVIPNLGEGPYSVIVTDANGCPTNCGFNISTDDCVTSVGSMSNSLLTNCGLGCITAIYSNLGEYIDTNDVLQYILHTGNGNQIVNEILRSDTPTFCFDAATMSYGVTYYISAAAGNNDGTGNVLLSDVCTRISVGTPIIFYQVPVASVAQPAPLTCLVQQTTLQGTSSLTGSTYSWVASQGGVIVGPANTANVNVNAAGTYTLTVTRNGCTSTASVQVIDLETTVTANVVSSPGEILDCTVSEITLSANVQGTTNANYAWFLNGQQVGTGQNYLLQDGGTYLVVVTDQASGCTGTASLSISDNTDYPQLTINPAPLLNCQDTFGTISGSSTVNGVTFQWVTISGSDTTVIGQGTSTQVNAPGTYYLIGTAPNGCQNGESVQVNGDYSQPTANAGSDETLDCYQTPLDLSGGGSAGISFFWTTAIPGVTIIDPTDPVITVDASGIYTLTVTDLGNFCTDSDDVEVFQYENVPQAGVQAEDPDCFGDENGSITLNTDPANGPYSFQLNGQNYGAQNYFAPLAPGTYQIQVTDGQGCTWTTSVTLTEPEQLVVDLGADLLLKLGETANIQAQYNIPASQLDTLIWTPAVLLPCPEMPCDEQEFLPTQQTVVTVTVIDQNGCRAEDLLSIFVKKDNPVYVPNSFSPNGDGTNDVFMIYAGKEVLNIKEFLVFDRWGETVYEYYNFVPNNPAYGWNGTYRGEDMNPAVFVWFAVVEFLDGSEVLLEGDVTLVR
ncbi:MAG: gliding motility-associated C-terminal domain-containing protein [Saprospiraceae bacterium]|nr:gliding motility-associated C-terminal domain-containing protein [Saprospiraceae bacterium]MCF8250617.1 gliding motility-associated C-terminal domain-containing protein [Saprospiraceae bacterium]MCF8282392.1 gliding motility-associated C-terminal domain-containing protein [Bacteroidales bacterium]MCF8312248.1 gliding motility-associated C-terminal domain-containing protein [Saprospiraceae bacterium]MCF8442805.1 gliding motility-associated C-terminal domain-containing protein [Saprospiraceae 